MYQVPVLTEDNWKNYLGKLHQHPIRVSCFHKLESYIHVKDIGFKYVFAGNEHYAFNRKGYLLQQGQYIIGNKHHSCEVSIKGNVRDWGICIDLDSNRIREALYAVHYPDAIDDEEICRPFFFSEELFRQACSAGTTLRMYLANVMNAAQKSEELFSIEDSMQQMSIAVLQDQQPLIRAYSRLHTAKTQTKREQFLRLHKAVSILRDSLTQEVNMAQVAREAMLSEFRLFHLFKSAFGITPYQFLLKERIEYASAVHKTTSYSWSEIAAMIGFSEPSAFSKAFKKIKGVSPANFCFDC